MRVLCHSKLGLEPPQNTRRLGGCRLGVNLYKRLQATKSIKKQTKLRRTTLLDKALCKNLCVFIISILTYPIKNLDSGQISPR